MRQSMFAANTNFWQFAIAPELDVSRLPETKSVPGRVNANNGEDEGRGQEQYAPVINVASRRNCGSHVTVQTL